MPSYCDERYRDICFSFAEIVNNKKKKNKKERGEEERKGKIHEERMYVSEMKREMSSCCSLHIVSGLVQSNGTINVLGTKWLFRVSFYL